MTHSSSSLSAGEPALTSDEDKDGQVAEEGSDAVVEAAKHEDAV